MTIRRRRLLLAGMICTVMTCVVLWLSPRKDFEYEIIDINPSITYPSYTNLMINDNGVVAGVISLVKFKLYHVFSWDQRKGFVDLGPLCSDGSNIWIEDINNKGQFIGSYRGTESLPEEILAHDPLIKTQIHSFLYDPENGIREIEAMSGCFNPQVKAINDNEDVVGFCNKLTTEGKISQRVFLWNPNTGIHDPNIFGNPCDINNQGHIVGIHQIGAFFWSPEEGVKNIGRADKCRINDSDEVAGIYSKFISETTEGFKVFRWSQSLGFQNLDSFIFKTGTQTLPAMSWNNLGQFCLSTNNHNFVFGIQLREQIDSFVYDTKHGKTYRRKIFDDNCSFLPDSINNNGWIIGLYRKDLHRYPAILIPKGQPEKD